jgi:hypothetical protein
VTLHVITSYGNIGRGGGGGGGGCSVALGRSRIGAWLAVAGVALAIAARRKRVS